MTSCSGVGTDQLESDAVGSGCVREARIRDLRTLAQGAAGVETDRLARTLRIPWRWVKDCWGWTSYPHEDQAQRLFERFEDLRERIDRDDQGWFDDLAVAGVRFLNEGELPGDELLCETVLANGEFFGLLRHYVGQGDAEVMSAFDQVATARGEARAAAIAGVQAMAAEGLMLR